MNSWFWTKLLVSSAMLYKKLYWIFKLTMLLNSWLWSSHEVCPHIGWLRSTSNKRVFEVSQAPWITKPELPPSSFKLKLQCIVYGIYCHMCNIVTNLMARPLTLHLHLQMHFYICNANADAGKPPTHQHVIQTRMKSDAKSLKRMLTTLMLGYTKGQQLDH